MAPASPAPAGGPAAVLAADVEMALVARQWGQCYAPFLAEGSWRQHAVSVQVDMHMHALRASEVAAGDTGEPPPDKKEEAPSDKKEDAPSDEKKEPPALAALSMALGVVGVAFAAFAVLLVADRLRLRLGPGRHLFADPAKVVLLYVANSLVFFVFGSAAAASLCLCRAPDCVRSKFGFFTTWGGRAMFFITSGAYCSAVGCDSFAVPPPTMEGCWHSGAFSKASMVIGLTSMALGFVALVALCRSTSEPRAAEPPVERGTHYLDYFAALASTGMILSGSRIFLECVTKSGQAFHVLEAMYMLPLALMLWLFGSASLVASLTAHSVSKHMAFLDATRTRGPFYIIAGAFIFATFFYQEEAMQHDNADRLCWAWGLLCCVVGVLLALQQALAFKS